MMSTFKTASLLALSFAGAALAQIKGTSTVKCIPSYTWASNSLGQNPCLIAAWLQSECADGSFRMDPLPPGYHYIGPTNDTSTQNPCICSTPVYQLVSACGACQNETYISWGSWKTNCPASMLAPSGEYTQFIPSDTSVPHWAYLRPEDENNSFDPVKAKAAGDTPESSQVQSTSSSTTTTSSTATSTSTTATTTTTSDISTTSTTTSPAASHHSSSNIGPIVGGVVGGVLGLVLIALLAFYLLRGNNNNNSSAQSQDPRMSQYTNGVATLPNTHVTGGSHITGNSGGGSFPINNGGYQGGMNMPMAQPGRYSGMPEV